MSSKGPKRLPFVPANATAKNLFHSDSKNLLYLIFIYCKDLPVSFMSTACIKKLRSLYGKYISIVIGMYYIYIFFPIVRYMCIYISTYLSIYEYLSYKIYI